LVSIFLDARSKQEAATKIRILIALPILRVLVVTNKAASLRRGENAMHFLSDLREGEVALSERLE
jgi:hypothetical protein